MRLAPALVSAPVGLPVTLDELKQHLRIDHSDEDGDLEIKLAAAVGHFDGWHGVLGRCLLQQQWRFAFDAFPASTVPLGFADVSAASVEYSDQGDNTQPLTGSAFQLFEAPGGSMIRLKTGQAWPATFTRPDAVRVTVTAGYGTGRASVPAAIRSAIMLRAGDLYHKREDASKPGGLIDMLIAPYSRTLMGGPSQKGD